MKTLKTVKSQAKAPVVAKAVVKNPVVEKVQVKAPVVAKAQVKDLAAEKVQAKVPVMEKVLAKALAMVKDPVVQETDPVVDPVVQTVTHQVVVPATQIAVQTMVLVHQAAQAHPVVQVTLL